nr:hypothetical protein Itr_chr04CG10840 [Ipomoea trifida]
MITYIMENGGYGELCMEWLNLERMGLWELCNSPLLTYIIILCSYSLRCEIKFNSNFKALL